MHGLNRTFALDRTQLSRFLKLGLQALILLPVIAGLLVYRAWNVQPETPSAVAPQAVAAAPTTISAQALAERFGIQIKLIGVTAAGGMVDFRYKVLDKDKAAFLFGGGSDTVKLVADDNGTTLTMPKGHGMNRHTPMKNGTVNFHFFANSGGAVKVGRPVTVLIGSLRLDPIMAQ